MYMLQTCHTTICMHDVNPSYSLHSWCSCTIFSACMTYGACMICSACMIYSTCMTCFACMMICMWYLLCMHDFWCMHDTICMHDLICNMNPMNSRSLLAINASRDSKSCEHVFWVSVGFIIKFLVVWIIKT